MEFEGDYSPLSLNEMQTELESIMRLSGVRWDWRLFDDSISKESFRHLVVVRFKGSCRAGEGAGDDEDPGALGITHISEGEILPFSEVDCDKLLSFIRPRLAHDSLPLMDRLLGRAMGRVLAHEFYHIFAGTTHHSHAGVAKSELTSRELVQSRLGFAAGESERIRKKLEPSAGQTAE